MIEYLHGIKINGKTVATRQRMLGAAPSPVVAIINASSSPEAFRAGSEFRPATVE